LDAETMCVDSDALLTSINTLAENSFVSELLGAEEGWLGGSYEGGIWEWVDGSMWNEDLGTVLLEEGVSPGEGDFIKMSSDARWVVVKQDGTAITTTTANSNPTSNGNISSSLPMQSLRAE